MVALTKYNPEERVIAFCRRIHNSVASSEDDLRLSEAQRYAGVLKVLRCDPAILTAKIIDLCLAKNSKWSVDPYTLHKMVVDLHHMVNASPDYRTRKLDVSDNQFELDFQWQMDGEGGRVATLEAAE